jgi:hypothetical protein
VRDELRVQLGERGHVRARPVVERRRLADLDLLPQPVREVDRALRVAGGCQQQRVQRLPHAPLRPAEPSRHVLRDVLVAEPLEPERDGRAVERPVLRLEQPLHHPGLGAREHVRRNVALVLDVAAQDRVELIHLRDVLELVEHDERATPPALREPQRQVEQRVQRRQRVALRVELQPSADAERTQREPEAGALQKLLDARTHLALQLPRVGTLDAHRHVGDRQHAVEVDEDRDEALVLLPVAQHAAEEARLAVLPRRVQPHVVAADGPLEQATRLVVAVDHLVGRDRPRVHERVRVRDHGLP